MKRLGSSDSLGALISMCPTEEQSSGSNNHIYSRQYHSILEGLDEDASMEEFGHVPEKKRRLSVTQVKALEKSFEVENKLEPERKVKLAQELGLQPRQVAVWFQNRRARWKTKQLERDYGVLKSNFDHLKLNFDSLQHEKDVLLNEIKELKSKLNEEDNRESNMEIKEETNLGPDPEKTILEPISPTASLSEDANMDVMNGNMVEFFKDGQSDSDSSAILNDQISIPIRFNSCDSSSSLSPSSSINCFATPNNNNNNNNSNVYHPQYVKMEEHNFFGGEEEEEACDFFSDEQAPTLQWCCSDQWVSNPNN